MFLLKCFIICFAGFCIIYYYTAIYLKSTCAYRIEKHLLKQYYVYNADNSGVLSITIYPIEIDELDLCKKIKIDVLWFL